MATTSFRPRAALKPLRRFAVALAALTAALAGMAGAAEDDAAQDEADAKRRALLEAGPPPFLFSVTDPASGRVAYIQGVPFGLSPALYPVHPSLDAVLDKVDRIMVDDNYLPAPAPDDPFDPEYDLVWTDAEKFYQAERLAVARAEDGGFVVEDRRRRFRVWSDVSAEFAAEALCYLCACDDAFRKIMPRTAAAPVPPRGHGLWPALRHGPWRWLLDMNSAWLLKCLSDPDFDISLRIHKNRGDVPLSSLDLFFGQPPAAYNVTYGHTENPTLAVEDPGHYRFGRAQNTRRTLRHEIAHALPRGGPDGWRAHSFAHEGWASFFDDLNPRAAAPTAEARNAAAVHDPTPMFNSLLSVDRAWPLPHDSFADAPLAWWPPEREASRTLTYGAGEAFAAFMLSDPARAERYDAAWARVRGNGGGELFGDAELRALAPAYEEWLAGRLADNPDEIALWAAKVRKETPPERRLPAGRTITAHLGRTENAIWRECRATYAAAGAGALGELEDCPPLAAVAEIEAVFDVVIEPGGTDLPVFEKWLAGEGRRRGKELASRRPAGWNAWNDLLWPVYRARQEGMTPAEEYPALRRTLKTMRDWGGRGAPPAAGFAARLVELLERDYDAWFAGDPAWLPADDDFSGFGRTRVESEWRRRALAPHYAGLVQQALFGEKTVLLATPMDCLAALPDNTRALLSAAGFLVEPVP